MNKRIYAVRDCKVGTFAPPCLFENDGVAVRAFGDLVANDKGVLGTHPEDFALYYLGEIDLETGHIVPCEPVSLSIASDFKAV